MSYIFAVTRSFYDLFFNRTLLFCFFFVSGNEIVLKDISPLVSKRKCNPEEKGSGNGGQNNFSPLIFYFFIFKQIFLKNVQSSNFLYMKTRDKKQLRETMK